jgi:hypothetical protein
MTDLNRIKPVIEGHKLFLIFIHYLDLNENVLRRASDVMYGAKSDLSVYKEIIKILPSL